MALDSYQQVWNRLLLRCPSLSPKLAQDFVVNAFRRLAEMRRWSWLVKFGQFIVPDVYSTGTVTVTLNSTTVTGVNTVWTAAMVGRQFRVGLAAPIYTVAQFNTSTSIELDSVWGGDSASGETYSIYQCFFTVPTDFYQFITVVDPEFAWQLFLDASQSEINAMDPQRANVGNSYLVSFRDYSSSQVGVVSQPLQVAGSVGPDPISLGTYTAPADAIFTIECTGTGIPGVATYQWKKNSGSYTTATTDAADAPQDLQDGVQVIFPTGQTYVVGNIWVVQATAISNPGLARYELWPAQQSSHVYWYLYQMRWTDLNDTGAVIPRSIPGSVILEMALEDVSLWPGLTDKPNPYYSDRMARYHRGKADDMIQQLELADNNIYQQDLQYSYGYMNWPFALPYGDAAWLQRHGV